MANKHLLTMEQQLKACGCCVVLLVAIAGILASLSVFIYVSLLISIAEFPWSARGIGAGVRDST